MRIYVTPKSKAEREALEVLRLYGVKPVLERDKRGQYYLVTPPDYWSSHRVEKFKDAIDKLDLN